MDLPKKSKDRYERMYNEFQSWRRINGAVCFSERTVLAYFSSLSKTNKPTTLWAYYSMLKSTLNIHHGVDISSYPKVTAFLKRESEGYRPRKTKVFSEAEMQSFISDAPDEEWLDVKVVLIFCVSGACRTDELVNISIDDVEIHGKMYLIKIPKSGTDPARSFAICDQYFDIVRKYHQLRPPNAQSNRFFLNYQKGKCTAQVIGKNKFCRMARDIAHFLKLEDADRYSAFSYRRSSPVLTKDSLNSRNTIEITSSSLNSRNTIEITSSISQSSTSINNKKNNNPENTLVNINTAGMTEDTIPSEVVAVEMGISNSEPIFCDVNNVKIEAPDSPSQADGTMNEPLNSNMVFCDTNVNIEGVNSFSQVLESPMEPSNSDGFFCEANAMDEELESSIPKSDLVFCDEMDLVDESVSKEQLLGTTPQLSNCKQIMQDQNGLTEIAEIANTTCEQILPPQSKEKYNSVYLRFQTWRKTKNVPISENVMLTYFTELMETMLPSSLWAIFSMLKATIKIYDQSDIGAFSKLIAFLKRNSENYIPKKSSFLSDENIEKFLNEAPDDHYLVIKVALIFGVMGGLRVDELVNILENDVTEHNGIFLVRIPKTKTKRPKSFTIHDEYFNIVKKYMLLRPQKPTCSNRFFLNYRNRTCTVQPIGKNKLAAMPRKIAEYLGLENPEFYTGHSFRRSSTKLIGNAIGDLFKLKRQVGWQSSKISVSDEFVVSETKTANMITSANDLPLISPPNIDTDVSTSPIHSSNESNVCFKTGFHDGRLSSSDTRALNLDQKIRTSSTVNNSSGNISDRTMEPSKRPFTTKRRCMDDWKKSDMYSPKLARRFFDLATNSIHRKNVSLQRLRSENHRLALRVESLESIIDEMKGNTPISENSLKMKELES